MAIGLPFSAFEAHSTSDLEGFLYRSVYDFTYQRRSTKRNLSCVDQRCFVVFRLGRTPFFGQHTIFCDNQGGPLRYGCTDGDQGPKGVREGLGPKRAVTVLHMTGNPGLEPAQTLW